VLLNDGKNIGDVIAGVNDHGFMSSLIAKN
jgi:hypothetical protein